MHIPVSIRCLHLLLCIAPRMVFGAPANTPVSTIAPSINSLGLDLYRAQVKTAGNQSVLLSPYSIATALAMTYVGADGETKMEMQRVLRFPADPVGCSTALQLLDRSLADVVKRSEKWVAAEKEEGGESAPIQLSSANRLFLQQGYALRKEFTDHAARYFTATLAELDFKNDPDRAREVINAWVADKTRNRIPEVLPAGQPTRGTRLALVNALYLKAAWKNAFAEHLTKDEPFHINLSQEAPVSTMRAQQHFGYAKHRGYSVVTVPYQTGSLLLVLFVPDQLDGLATLEKELSAEELADCARLAPREVILHLPRFKLEPATMLLAKTLQALGLKTAFDQPAGSANFDRMAPRQPDDYLSIGEVFHKTWLSLDEQGTEAAAATVITLVTLGIASPRETPPPPVEVRADRPFLFAIQHVESGVCLFLGRVMDPR